MATNHTNLIDYNEYEILYTTLITLTAIAVSNRVVKYLCVKIVIDSIL